MTPPEVNPASALDERTYEHAPVVRNDHAEGPLTRLLEQQTAQLPSSFFLMSSVGAMAAAVILELRGRHRLSTFVAMWAPSLMMAGIYNKLIKTMGSR